MEKKLRDKKTLYTKAIDYTVSNKEFKIYHNKEYDLLYTDPIPDDLSSYYESEDYISHTDSKKTIIDKVYQLVKNYTIKKKLKLINSFHTNEKTLLDIGAGTGDFINFCKKNNWNVVGVEPSKKAKEIASTKELVLLSSIEEIKEEKYDVITMWHVLEHIPNLNEYIKALKKLLKKDGVLVIAVPNFKSYDANHYKNFWAAYDVPRHIWHFSKKSISQLFSDINMKVEKILPMKFDSYYVSILSEKYKNGKNNFIKAFFTGLTSNLKAMNSKEYSSLIYIIKNM
ncbi:class I SAM-dependent methyltransferase [Tenacibaculum sp. M341]|uniref:class I SAM-dependent methyltransferase n=1 Tax=Tenacibaculum sp. M341 TaxID=2530339 RepID=UPI00105193B6|nr:class I SAM-dependent methyltransferase [Tenacibaculum sp. M341]TCI92118.1 class I SAM-dependent methyltransferase [Tenacibaculum sp. M341]